MTNYKINLYFLVLTIVTIFVSCRKTGEQSNTILTLSNDSKFFTNHASINPLVQAITRFSKGQNNKFHFVDKLVEQIGFPFWDKAITVAGNTASRGASDSNFITFIPFVRDTQNHVNATLEVATSPMDTTFRILCDWQYNDTLQTGLSPKKFALTMMLLDNAVFGNRRYKLVDSTIFDSKVGYLKLDPTSLALFSSQQGRAGRTSTVTTLVCWTEWFPGNQGQVNGCPPGMPPEECNPLEWQYVCIEITWNPPGSGGGGTGGGTGNGNGGNGNSSGGSGNGYSGGGWVPPPCNGIPVARGATYENCTPGWIPPPPSPTLPCDEFIIALQNNATFKEKFISLNDPQTTGNSFEKGFMVTDRVNNLYQANQGNSFNANIIWNVTAPVDGLLHSHYIKLSNVFSPDDILFMARLYLAGLAKDSANLFFGMTSYTGPPFLIKISNNRKFRTFAEKIVAMEAGNEGFNTAFKKKLDSGDNTKNLKEFFKMLYHRDLGGFAGIDVYEAEPDISSNYNFNQWKKLNWNNNFEDFNASTNCF